MPNRKLDIVTHLYEYIPEDRRESIDQAMVTWWTNIRRDGGLRLTKHGYDLLHNVLKMESWSVDLPEKTVINKRQILEMDRKLAWPYFIDVRKNRKRIIFFSSREAMMASIYGDLGQWLNNLS